jgi:hypothetical protein
MLIKPKIARIDKARKFIKVGDWVRLSRAPGKFPVHPEWLRVFNRYSGRVLKVVGWDAEGYAWLDIGREVLSVEPQLLKIVKFGHKP